ncbi:MAG: DUF4321 domain-containing protein [Bacillota bacterium]
MTRVRRTRSPGVSTVVVVILALSICGGVLGELVGRYLPLFGKTTAIGIEPPFTVDLFVVKVSLGLVFRLNLGSVLGALIGVVLVARS